MKRNFLFCIGLWTCLSACRAGDVCATPADSVKVCQLLQKARQQNDVNPLFFARQFLGVPYVAHTLEVQDEEGLVVNTRELDCTTFVETVTALTLCARRQQYTWRDYVRTLTSMRYRGGKINGYPSRIHYYTDWISENGKPGGIVTALSQPNPPFSAVQTVKVDYMSTHPDAYKALRQHPEYVKDIRQMEQRVSGGKFRYIPRSAVKNTKLLRETIHDGDIIAITCTKPGLDIAHLGFALWKEDGLHFLHASMMRKKVLIDPLLLGDYLKINKAYTGIRVIRINK